MKRVNLHVENFDNCLSQIIDLEGPSTDSETCSKNLFLDRNRRRWSVYSSSLKQYFDESGFDRFWESPKITFVRLCSHIDAYRWNQISHCVDQGTSYDRWLEWKHSTDNFIYHKRQLKINFFLTDDIKFIQLVKRLQSVTSVFSSPLFLKPNKIKIAGVKRTQQTGTRFWSQWCCLHMVHHKPAPLKGIEWRFFHSWWFSCSRSDNRRSVSKSVWMGAKKLWSSWQAKFVRGRGKQFRLIIDPSFFLNFLLTGWNLPWWRSFQENRKKIWG